MTATEINNLYKALDVLIKENKFNNNYVITFGANKTSDLTVRYLGERGIIVNAIIDNNPDKWNKIEFGLKIYKPAELLNQFNERAIILIASRHFDEMCLQLEALGFIKNIHIFKTLNFRNYTLDYPVFKEKTAAVLDGYNLYCEIKAKFGEDITILINPYTGIGDSYFICGYLETHLEKFNIKNYILTTVGNSPKKASEMFGGLHTLSLTQEQTDKLAALCAFTEFENCRIKVISHMYLHTDILVNFEGKRRLNWGELIRDVILGLDKSAERKPLIGMNRESFIESLFEDKKLIKNKTVILAPYAIAVNSLPDAFWSNLALHLKQKGYTVCTNCHGEFEKPVESTISISFPIEDATAVTEYAGIFISLRSGLCDIISSSKCKKIILYPSEDTLFFFGLNNIGLPGEALELVYNDTEAFSASILGRF